MVFEYMSYVEIIFHVTYCIMCIYVYMYYIYTYLLVFSVNVAYYHQGLVVTQGSILTGTLHDYQ